MRKFEVPFDLFDGNIKKGSLLISSVSGNYKNEENPIFLLPKEIVETWKEVYDFKEKDFVTVENSFDGVAYILLKSFDKDNSLIKCYMSYSFGTVFPSSHDFFLDDRKIRFSTKEEIKHFISKMENVGYIFNSKTKEFDFIHKEIMAEWKKTKKELEFYDLQEWVPCKSPLWTYDIKYRFKPEPQIIPFTREDHVLFKDKWVKKKGSLNLLRITGVYNDYLNISTHKIAYSYIDMLSNFIFEDDSPFGKPKQ